MEGQGMWLKKFDRVWSVYEVKSQCTMGQSAFATHSSFLSFKVLHEMLSIQIW
jgi:hypothetical protein